MTREHEGMGSHMTETIHYPLVSVVVPIYMVEQYLDQCIESIVDQEYKNLEIILVDDGSTDSCPSRCDRWAHKDQRISVIHQDNRGLSAARNAGLRRANGEFILFVDSDDWIDQRLVSGCIDAARQYHAGVVGYKYQIVGRRVRPEKQSEHNAFEAIQSFEGDQALKAILDLRVDDFAWAYMVRRRIVDENHIQFPMGRSMEDVATTYRIFAGAGHMVRLPNVYYFYRSRSGSILDTQSVDMVGDYVTAESEIVHFSMEYPQPIRESALRRLVKTMWWCNRTTVQKRCGKPERTGEVLTQINVLLDDFQERIDHIHNLSRKEYIQYHLMRTPRVRRFTRQLLALLTAVHLIKTN